MFAWRSNLSGVLASLAHTRPNGPNAELLKTEAGICPQAASKARERLKRLQVIPSPLLAFSWGSWRGAQDLQRPSRRRAPSGRLATRTLT